jgi:hypothetical protein
MWENRILPLKIRVTEYTYPYYAPIQVCLWVVQGETPPGWPNFCPYFLHKHPQPIKRPQSRYRGLKIAPRTVTAMEGLAETVVLFATSPQLGKNNLGAEIQPKCKP